MPLRYSLCLAAALLLGYDAAAQSPLLVPTAEGAPRVGSLADDIDVHPDGDGEDRHLLLSDGSPFEVRLTTDALLPHVILVSPSGESHERDYSGDDDAVRIGLEAAEPGEWGVVVGAASGQPYTLLATRLAYPEALATLDLVAPEAPTGSLPAGTLTRAAVDWYTAESDGGPFTARLSGGFNVRLVLVSPSGWRIVTDDYSSDVTIAVEEGEVGQWWIGASAYFATDSGEYRIEAYSQRPGDSGAPRPAAAARIVPEETPIRLTGRLSPTDARRNEGEPVVWYEVESDGRPFSARMEADFTTTLVAESPSGARYETDVPDTAGTGWVSSLRLTQGEPGLWRLGASALLSYDEGPYTLEVRVQWAGEGETGKEAGEGQFVVERWRPPEAPDAIRLMDQTSHSGIVRTVRYSPAGSLVASGGGDEVKVWDAGSGLLLHTMPHEEGVSALAWSPDETLLAGASGAGSSSEDGAILVWDIASGAPVARFRPPEDETYLGISDLTFSPDGSHVVAAWETYTSGDGPNRSRLVWVEVATGRVTRTIETEVVVNAFALAGNRWLVAGMQSEATPLLAWDLDAEAPEAHPLPGHTRDIVSVRASADGSRFATAALDRRLLVWEPGDTDPSRWSPLATIDNVVADSVSQDVLASTGFITDYYAPGQRYVSSVHALPLSFTPDASGVWLGTESWHQSPLPDGTYLLDRPGYLHLFEVASGEAVRSHRFDYEIDVFDASPLGATPSPLVVENVGRIEHLDARGRTVSASMASPDGVDDLLRDGDRVGVQSGSDYREWSLDEGHLLAHHEYTFGVAGVTDGGHLIDVHSSFVSAIDRATGKRLWRYEPDEEGRVHNVSAILDPLGRFVAVAEGADGSITLVSVRSGEPLAKHTVLPDSFATGWVGISPDGRTLAASGSTDRFSGVPSGVHLWRIKEAGGMVRLTAAGRLAPAPSDQIARGAFSPDGRLFASAKYDGQIWDVATATPLVELEGARGPLAFSPDGTLVAGRDGGEGYGISLWRADTGKPVRRLPHPTETEHPPAPLFAADGQHLLTGSSAGTVHLWRVHDGVEMARLHAFSDSTWLVVTPEGRFDAPDLERITGAVWVAPDDPLTPLPIEAFMREYYEPRLLPRLLAGEAFPDIGSLLERNRVQPRVEIVGVAPDASGAAARVTVRAEGVERTYGGTARTSGVRDVRLFRDGQLVGWTGADSTLIEGVGTWERTFTIPLASGADSVSFSAYAFNRDLVKSRTAYVDLAVPPEARPQRPRRAFIVSLGVDRFDDPRWDLLFAAADARAYHAALDSTLTASGEYDAVVAVELVSDHDRARSTDATAAALRGALLRLAGDPLDADAEAALARVPGAERLDKATPDDVVIVTASTHGYASPEGIFYLLPSDVPTVTDGPALGDAAFLEAAVSSDELSLWLRGVDAGTLAVVVDACNAAGAVEGNDFKPGPMGARGLGQLAFDKGAAVLTATQADAPALETSATERGLLTFALVENGLLARQADGASGEAPDGRITLEEWLAYGVARVPGLYAEVASDSVSTYGRGGGVRVRSLLTELAGPELAEGEEGSGAQTPALFDFRKGARPTTLATRPRAEE